MDVRLAVLRPNETRKGPRRRDDARALGRGALGAGRAVLLGLRVGRSMARSTGIASLGHPRAVGTRAARGADSLGVDGLRRGRLGAVGRAVGGAARRAEPPVVLGAAVAVPRPARRSKPASRRRPRLPRVSSEDGASSSRRARSRRTPWLPRGSSEICRGLAEVRSRDDVRLVRRPSDSPRGTRGVVVVATHPVRRST